MGATVTNLIAGPGDLYCGDFGAAEPLDTAWADPPTTPTPWADAGGTSDGVNLTVGQSFMELEVDQVVDRAGSRVTKRSFGIQANLAEPTLENLALAMNSTAGVTTGGTGATQHKKLEPETTTSVTQPTYKALIFDGWAPEQLRRRVLARKMLVIDDVEFAYKKDKQTILTVSWAGHYVSSSIKPYAFIDGDPA